MNTKLVRLFAIFGIFAPIFGLFIIFTSITIAPSFHWDKNAISDLGVGGFEAVFFNAGMGMTAAVSLLFSACLFEYSRESNIGMVGASIHLVGSFCILGIGIANKSVEPWHLVAAIGLFVCMPLSTIVMGFYQFKRGDRILPILATFCVLISLCVWFIKWPSIAIPEMISILSMTLWQISLANWIRDKTRDSEPSIVGINPEND